MSLHTWLNIVGPALSIVGFALVSFELYRVQQREFGTPKTIRTVARFKRLAWRRVAGLFQKPDEPPDTPEPKPAYLDLASAEGHSSTSAILTTGTPLEGRVQTMEIRLARLADELAEDRKSVSRSLEVLRRLQAEKTKGLELKVRQHEEREREFSRVSIALNSWGTALFVVGTMVSASASIMSGS